MRWSRTACSIAAVAVAVAMLAVVAGATAAESPPAARAVPAGKAQPTKAVPVKTAAPPKRATAVAPARPPEPVLRVGVEGAYPPFSEVAADGKITGFDIDIANALCAEMAARCELVRQDWGRIQDGLLARETDLVVASLSMTAERRERYAFTDKYYQVPARFVARRGAAVAFDGALPRGGAIVGVQEGTAQADSLAARSGGAAAPVRHPTLPAALDALKRGEVAVVLGDALALDLGFLKTPEGRAYEFVGPGLADPDRFGEGVGIAVRKEDAALRERLNAALGRLRASGRYQAIANRYFAFDIYGADAVPPPPRVRYGGGAAFVGRGRLPELLDGPAGSQRR